MEKVLFICMGNICRSAMAEGILRDKIRRQNLPLQVDSAGTHRYHNGDPYDARARAELRRHGIDVDDLRSRRVKRSDFDEFDTIFAADKRNLADLRDEFGDLADKVRLITAHSVAYSQREIPDPYYGGPAGFIQVCKMLDEAIDAWLKNSRYLN